MIHSQISKNSKFYLFAQTKILFFTVRAMQLFVANKKDFFLAEFSFL